MKKSMAFVFVAIIAVVMMTTIKREKNEITIEQITPVIPL
jgi:hypothetical protein